MKRSIAISVIAAALGLSACTSTPAPAPDSATTSTSSSPTTQAVAVVTEVVTQTVTNPPPPPAKPVIGSFGYGALKLGMPLQQALDTKLIGSDLNRGGGPAGACTLHQLTGITSQYVWVSPKYGVVSISFTPGMTSDGVGVGATEAKLKAEYTNLKEAGSTTSFTADADGNPKAYFFFGVYEGKLTTAFISLKGHEQGCHS